MKLFIANTTLQPIRIHFRLPEQPQKSPSMYAEIRPLSQELVLDSSDIDIDCVINQIEVYGACNVRDVKSSSINPMIYSDKEIKLDRIGSTHESNQDKLDKSALESRKIAAIAASSTAGSNFEVSIEEQGKRGVEKKLMTETISVKKK